MIEGLARQELAADAFVFQAGDPGDCAYVIEDGCVEILAGTGETRRRVAILGRGAMFGEVALLDGLPRTATARAVVATTLVRIEREQVEGLIKRADPVIRYLLKLLLSRFRSAQDQADGDQLAREHLAREKALSESTLNLQEAAVRTLTLVRDLGHAIDAGQMELFYQPLVAYADGGTIGYEALIRWRHPTLGLVSPMEFIALAEKTDLIHRIGRWVMERAAADWRDLRAHCRPGAGITPFMSINLSAPELADAGIVAALADCIARHAVPAPEIRIELTETIIVDNLEAVSANLRTLGGMGFGIALDDFGTGYAGLDYLRALPFSCLKIDKVFVQQMAHGGPSLEIVRAAIDLGRALGLKILTEGVEDADTARRLADMGCDYAQGYFYGKPMPKDAVAAWAAGRD
ncbi:MAG TPA: EAL domain-containing protein [Rhodocyclaceae bacterium]|nr:EAL domain-containing protein [Rhodocyclaceae bacterium]